MTDAVLSPRARSIGKIIAWVLGGLLIAAVFATAWVGVRGWLAYEHLRDAQTAAGSLSSDLETGGDIGSRAATIADDTAAARALTSDAVWKAGEILPWVGPQLSAVSTVAAAVDDVARGALTPLAGDVVSFSAGAITPVDGHIDTAAFAALDEKSGQAASTAAASAASVRHIATGPLVRPLREAVEKVSTLLGDASAGTDALSRTTKLLPTMLGADGPRDYLVIFQNNAEWRSLGGIPGAMALIHTDNGSITLAAQDSSSGFPAYHEPVLPLADDISRLYGSEPAEYIQDVTQVPDFSVAGALAREMWAREHGGQQVDGVISLDPVALSYILKATGPVLLSTGDVLTADNAVSLLLNGVYLRYSNPADQDAFFASAAASIFDALSRGTGSPQGLLTALARAGKEHRLLMWSAHPQDQQVLTGTTLVGALPSTDANAATFGVFVADGTGSKMDYYATLDASIAWKSCTLTSAGAAEGTATLTVTLTNGAPADAAKLPPYITGGGFYGVSPGTARTTGHVYLPKGFRLTDATSSDGFGFGGGTLDDRQVVLFSADLAPGQSTTVTLSATTTVPGATTLTTQVTPTADPASKGSSTAICGT